MAILSSATTVEGMGYLSPHFLVRIPTKLNMAMCYNLLGTI